MTTTIHERNLFPLIAIVLVGVSGCGVSEYEKRMDEQGARIKAFDAINQMLEDPLEMPKIKTINAEKIITEVPAWSVEIFLRLPKGYGTALKDKEKEKTQYNAPFPCFRYNGGSAGSNIFVAVAPVVAEKAKKKDGEYTDKEFKAAIRAALEEFHFKALKLRFVISEKAEMKALDVKAFVPMSGPAPSIAYQLLTFKDTGVKDLAKQDEYRLYFCRDADRQVCIVVHRFAQIPNEDAFTKGMEACLGTLDMSGEAPAKRAQFLRAKTGKKS